MLQSYYKIQLIYAREDNPHFSRSKLNEDKCCGRKRTRKLSRGYFTFAFFPSARKLEGWVGKKGKSSTVRWINQEENTACTHTRAHTQADNRCILTHSSLYVHSRSRRLTDVKMEWTCSEPGWLDLMTHPEETLKSSFHYCEPTFYPCKSDSLFSRVQFPCLFFSSLAHFPSGPKPRDLQWTVTGWLGTRNPLLVWYLTKGASFLLRLEGGRGGHKQTASEQAGKHPSLQTWGGKKKTRSQQESRIRDLSFHTSAALGAAASSASVYPCQGAAPSTCGYTHTRENQLTAAPKRVANAREWSSTAMTEGTLTHNVMSSGYTSQHIWDERKGWKYRRFQLRKTQQNPAKYILCFILSFKSISNPQIWTLLCSIKHYYRIFRTIRRISNPSFS